MPMDSDQLPCLDMDTDLFKAVMTGDMGYFHNPTHDLQSIPCKATSQQQNVLHIAADFKCIDLAKYLVALFPVLLTRANFRGNTPLHIASKRGCSEMVACFLEREVAEQALEMKNDETDDTALHVAVRNGHLEVVKLLVKKNSKLLDLVNKHKESPLFLAVVMGSFEIAEFMLEGYSSVCSCEGPKGMTALHAAVIHTHKDIMKLLLEKKKDVIRQADEFGWSPLHYAAHLGHHETTKKLLVVDGYIAGLCDAEQSFALHIAAKNGHSNVIEEIIACRPDVYNLVDYKGRTILHLAAQFGKAGVVNYILKKPNLESLINEPDEMGNTALHLAAIHQNYWVVTMLAADNRVDKRAMNNEYLKTIDILVSEDYISIIMVWAMIKLRHTGGGRRFHRFVKREQKKLENGENELAKELTTVNTSSDGGSHTASNMSRHGKRKRKEVMEAKEQLVSHRLKGVSKVNLLVAALIATVTFQAGFSPPGGFHDEGPHKGIVAVLSTDKTFKDFLESNGSAFYFSTAALTLHFYTSMRQSNDRLRLLLVQISAVLIFGSILEIMMAFSYSFYFALRSSLSLSTTKVFSDVSFCFLLVVLFYIIWNPKKLWKLV